MDLDKKQLRKDESSNSTTHVQNSSSTFISKVLAGNEPPWRSAWKQPFLRIKQWNADLKNFIFTGAILGGLCCLGLLYNYLDRIPRKINEVIKEESILVLKQLKSETPQAGPLLKEHFRSVRNAEAGRRDLELAERRVQWVKGKYSSLPKGTVVRRQLGASKYVHPIARQLDSAEQYEFECEKELRIRLRRIDQINVSTCDFLGNLSIDEIKNPAAKAKLSEFQSLQAKLHHASLKKYIILTFAFAAYILVVILTHYVIEIWPKQFAHAALKSHKARIGKSNT